MEPLTPIGYLSNPLLDIKTDKDASDGVLKKELSLMDLTLMGLGNVIGAGVFVILGKSILYGGNHTIAAFIVVAIVSIIMGFVYLEIYSRHKSNIMEYTAIKDTMGDDMGKVALYVIYLFAVLSAVTIVISMSKYISKSQYFSYHLGENVTFEVLFGIVIITLMCAINYLGIHFSKLVAISITVLMLAVLGGAILLGAPSLCVNEVVTMPEMPWDSIVLSGILSLFLFNGYDFIVKVSDETIDPNDNKNALIYTLIMTSVIYLLIIVTGICVLKFKTASTTYNLISKIYEKVAGKNAGIVTYIAGLLIMFNTAFLSLLSASRFIYSTGKENHISNVDFWKKLSDYNTPTNAIIVTFIISVIFSLINSEVVLTIFSNFSALFILVLLCVALLVIRWNERDKPAEQAEHNYILGNVNNIPIPVIIALILIIYAKYKIIKHRFWLDTL
jgi:APA family basic amino acid/polyamine antiporter